ncbi:thiamine pyrophosphate-binding protein [Amycolatopsis rubida]|uniref:Thiamine pyrophosphate-binding protein n=1 Tax=Amycolatopsis rubida TaxID=112413 RepID=A0ABX0BW77_9PSEU|nr:MULTISPECIES: thiamine pyrophosphate-binding protein [Amycolatopsis]MYW94863.1 thiamine pyrophosphate-binding protein [Amycolatopsis rubida]NEC59850.1 thiamine pyrophosphate-binding protein [Amycolatopsis rubida]OAP26622.1 Acetolactate synthase isozyme 1 large subunit [Amycolatopsis sp. M39]
MTRIGGDVVVETLRALGADTVFGLPGQHALGLFEALRRAEDLRVVSSRVENNLAFAADGHARARLAADPHGPVPVTPMIVSTGPGALLTLASLQESRAASVPVLGISSQVPVAGLGGGRHGYLHELPDQQASFRDIVKSVHVVRSISQIPTALREAWESAATAPYGPVWVEVPQDVLLAPANLPQLTSVTAAPAPLEPLPELVAAAAKLLAAAKNPVILAGGGALRSGAQDELRLLAETLRAPVVSTFGGKGVFAWDHELSAQSWMEDWHTTEFLSAADVLLVLGSGLGELSSNYREFAPRGQVVQVEADLGKLESNYPALALHADVRHTLRALLGQLAPRTPDGRAEAAVKDLLARVESRLDSQPLALERKLIGDLRAALPEGTQTFWDMTIAAYWAWSVWNPDGAPIHTAQGAGGLGYGLPGALGAAAAGVRTLAVSGDGGAMYGLAELATAVQHQLDVTWLVVDDGGYGILREYLTGAFGQTTATELPRPDFAALAESFGIPARKTTVDTVRADLADALRTPGPSVVVLPALLKMFAPTHLEHS